MSAPPDAATPTTALPTWFRLRTQGALGTAGGVLVTLFLLLALTFIIGRLLPIDPVLSVVGSDADQAAYDQVRREMGLDQPLFVQFFVFVTNMLTLDFGNALLTNRPVIDDLIRVFPATLELATATIIVGAGLGVPLGVWAAVNRGKLADHVVRLISLLGYSTPIFWLGLIGLIIFYAKLGWVGGSGRLEIYYVDMVPDVTGMLLIDSLLAWDMDVFWSAFSHIVLPASVLGYASIAYISRMTRSFMLEQLGQEYVIAARAKGVPKRQVIWRHAFKNIRVQVVTIVALSYGSMLEGAVLIETVFGWPGFGQYLTNALLIGDMNAVVACTLIVGCVFIGLNLLSDLLYRFLDPRTR
ncbi:ABC transporter permease [Marinivivus vitaminiproducens]|uniref:ABC transporter permease n=1 Tax=Marinivivus vitaminiproducens TaxID=3035935 RepID=UPI0027A71E44|nr:ABC transporter permease [Geminicoccaceae bacterium SCSIO 64248]